MPRCSSNRSSQKFHFPKNEKIGCQWKDAVAAEKLRNLTYEEIHKQRYSVCKLHFETKYLSSNQSRILPHGVPTLHLHPEYQINEADVVNIPTQQGIDLTFESNPAAINAVPQSTLDDLCFMDNEDEDLQLRSSLEVVDIDVTELEKNYVHTQDIHMNSANSFEPTLLCVDKSAINNCIENTTDSSTQDQSSQVDAPNNFPRKKIRLEKPAAGNLIFLFKNYYPFRICF